MTAMLTTRRLTTSKRDNVAAADSTIMALAELYPQTFVAEAWKPHRALKRGIHQELVAQGILQAEKCRMLFRRYTSRLQYQRCLVEGGARFGLDGQPDGEVTDDELAGADKVLAHITAKRPERAAAWDAERKAARQVKRATQKPHEKPRAEGMPSAPQAAAAPPTPAPRAEHMPDDRTPSPPRRLGLADLKAAAQARKAAA